jgi:hypothetical protein
MEQTVKAICAPLGLTPASHRRRLPLADAPAAFTLTDIFTRPAAASWCILKRQPAGRRRSARVSCTATRTTSPWRGG